MSTFGVGDLGGLHELLQDESIAERARERQANKPALFTPGDIGRPAPQAQDGKEGGTAAAPARDPNEIWEADEVPSEDAILDDPDDNRPTPKYQILYKQDVGSEDVYLGMSEKTPGSQDCTHLVVKVYFPGSTMRSLDLHVTRNLFRAESRTHKLRMYLPQPVDSDAGQAKWDSKKEILSVTLPITLDDDEEGDVVEPQEREDGKQP